MELKTKYGIDDTIYFLYENTIHRGTIVALNVEVRKNGECITYEISCGYNLQLHEGKLFKTEEELVENLLSDFSKRK